jgi:hypothetical protein
LQGGFAGNQAKRGGSREREPAGDGEPKTGQNNAAASEKITEIRRARVTKWVGRVVPGGRTGGTCRKIRRGGYEKGEEPEKRKMVR